MKLAINGGNPVRTELFPAYITVGEEEKQAVSAVIDSGVLSRFLGSDRPAFYGGDQVQAMEREWAAYFGAKHAVSMNSATSGLYAAVGATRVGPGDEIIVSPYTMTASATAALVYGAIPVFADIDPETYCLDPESVARCVSERTRAIIAVDLFGHPYNRDAINAIARKHHLLVIEDTAQAPGATYDGQYTGTLGDIGVFSLNYHKHIHCGEGGVCVTNDDDLAERMRLIRNHGEAVVATRPPMDLTNLLGFNYRMTEIEAAISRCQLRKLKGLLEPRLRNCEYLATRLAEVPPVRPIKVDPKAKHAYYVQPFHYDAAHGDGVHRNRFITAVKAELPATRIRETEGPLIGFGYTKPLYLQPMYQQRIAIGNGGFPFTLARPEVSYDKGICPRAEYAHEHDLFVLDLVHSSMTTTDLDSIVDAFAKVWKYRAEL